MRTQANIKPKTIEYKKRLRALDINGKTYLGVETAILNYLKDNDLKIKDVQWNIGQHYIILADNIELFKEAFDELHINWDEV